MSSEAFIIRDKIKTRMEAMPFFNGFHFHTNKAEQIQPQNIPLAGIYFITEDRVPDGDANVGAVRFRSSATYGISVIVQNNDATAAENKLDAAWEEFEKIFVDPTLYNWKNVVAAWNGSDAVIQGYIRGSRSHQFGNAGADNAIPIAEMRFNLTCDLGVIEYDPTIIDDFITMHVETRYPGGDTPDKISKRQQVIVQYDIPQN